MAGRNAKEAGRRDRRAGRTGDTDCEMRRLDTVSADTRPLPRPAPAPAPADPPLSAAVTVLLRVCATHGVDAVVPVLDERPELLGPLTAACWRAGLVEATHYLHYLAFPMD